MQYTAGWSQARVNWENCRRKGIRRNFRFRFFVTCTLPYFRHASCHQIWCSYFYQFCCADSNILRHLRWPPSGIHLGFAGGSHGTTHEGAFKRYETEILTCKTKTPKNAVSRCDRDKPRPRDLPSPVFIAQGLTKPTYRIIKRLTLR